MEFFSDFLKDSKKSPSLAIYNATFNHLVQFAGKNIPVKSITPKFLTDFEKYLSEKWEAGELICIYLQSVKSLILLWMNMNIKGYEFRYRSW